jgi:hypothetical protein
MNKELVKSILLASVVAAFTTTASAAVYTNDFNFADGTTNFGDGSTSQSSIAGQGIVQGGQLRLTTANITSINSSITIPAMANSSLGWTATFSYTMSDAAGGLQPADGWSFNYGNIPLGGLSAGGPEEGWAPGTGVDYVTACVDTWQNGNPDSPDVTIGTNLGSINTVLADQDGTILNDGQAISGTVSITYNPATGLSFVTTGQNNNAAFANIALPGFIASDAFTFGLAARTGGATQDFLIDNLVITTVPEAGSSLLAALAGLGLLTIRRRK